MVNQLAKKFTACGLYLEPDEFSPHHIPNFSDRFCFNYPVINASFSKVMAFVLYFRLILYALACTTTDLMLLSRSLIFL
jgi:hypothetical protein